MITISPTTFPTGDVDAILAHELSHASGIKDEQQDVDQVDSDSRVTGKTWTLGGSQVNDLAYSYDADGRVVEESGNTTATAMVLPGLNVGSNTYNADNEMTSFLAADDPLTYDANGNLTSDGQNTYTWDARNHLSAISGGSFSFAYAYDALDRRVSKNVAGTTTEFVYDGLNPVQELQSGSASANLLTGLNLDELFQRTDSAGARALLTDALGSTWGLADSSGTVQSEYSYQPFGSVTPSGATSTNPYLYTGREDDGGAGPFDGDLYYNRARYYSPLLQRFMSQDPIGFAGGDTNLYGYVWNNPTGFIDPRGLWGVGAVIGGSGEIGLGGGGEGGTASAGGGVFFSGLNPSLGAFATAGAFARTGSFSAAFPNCPGKGGRAVGAFLGGGLNAFVTTANSVADLAGPFRTYSLNVGLGVRLFSLQYSVGKNAEGQTIRLVSFSIPWIPYSGAGYGASVSAYNTNTVTTEGGGSGCGCR